MGWLPTLLHWRTASGAGTTEARGDWWKQLHKLAEQHDMEPLSWERPHIQLEGVTLADIRAGRFTVDGDDDWWGDS
ncbi:hypothetical protein [Paracoccus tibetensis]|uniref:hypothetical protein n=1 Tax=Paracoccus tibetensis TaxID=336292 RepID=UPI000B84A579|nr:hypothetical protein [Paracoccus tibetensis]